MSDSSNFIRYDADPEYISELVKKIQNLIETIIDLGQVNETKKSDYFFKYDPLMSFSLF